MSVQRDIDAELRFHLEARVDALVEEGLSREDARAKALEEFGDVNSVRMDLREIDGRVARRRSRVELLDGLRQDLVYAARSLRRAPAVSLTIIATLALGLGANAAMFSLLDVIFLRTPAGVSQPETLRRVWSRHNYNTGPAFGRGYGYAGFAAIAKAVEGQATTTYYRPPTMRKLGRGENAPSVAVGAAAGNYFSVIGVHPQIGRFFANDEDRLDAPAPVIIISDALWKRELGGRQSAIGERITISNETFTVIGVTPPYFSGTELDATDVWMTTATWLHVQGVGRRPWWQNPNVNGFQVLLRLTPTARESELMQRTTVALRAPGVGFSIDSQTVAVFGSIIAARGPGNMKAELKVATRTAGVALIVLVIALANVINLLLARAVQRRREIAVRLALGISRGRLIRLLVTESVLLAVLATFAAMVAAAWGGSVLRSLLMPEIHFAETPLHWRVLVFALLLAIAVGGLVGLIPALQSAAPDLANALKAGGREGGRHRSRLRSALVVFQAALSVVLLVGAVLFVRSLDNVKSRDIGYTVNSLAFASVSYDTRDSSRDAALPARIRALGARSAAIPGVEAVAYTSMRPIAGITWIDAWYPDVDTTGKRKPMAIYTAVSTGYFSAIGTRLLSGREFRESDITGEPAVIVNEAMAKAVWGAADPIGHCVRFDKPDTPCVRVIGVAQTALFTSLNEKPEPRFYLSIDRPPTRIYPNTEIVVRSQPSRLPSVQKAISDLIRTEFVGAVPTLATMAHDMEPEYRPWQLGATLFTLFGALALLVAGIGIYSTVSYAVNQRTHEFGVRIALGARTADVLRQVLGEGLRTVIVGVALGIVLALLAARVIASLLYGIGPRDPSTMMAVAAMLVGVAAVAALLPAWRAAKADPVTALRAD